MSHLRNVCARQPRRRCVRSEAGPAAAHVRVVLSLAQVRGPGYNSGVSTLLHQVPTGGANRFSIRQEDSTKQPASLSAPIANTGLEPRCWHPRADPSPDPRLRVGGAKWIPCIISRSANRRKGQDDSHMCRRTPCFTAHATPPWLACSSVAQMAHTGGITRLRARSNVSAMVSAAVRQRSRPRSARMGLITEPWRRGPPVWGRFNPSTANIRWRAGQFPPG